MIKIPYKDSMMDRLLYKRLRKRGWTEKKIRKLVIGQLFFGIIVMIIGLLIMLGE